MQGDTMKSPLLFLSVLKTILTFIVDWLMETPKILSFSAPLSE